MLPTWPSVTARLVLPHNGAIYAQVSVAAEGFAVGMGKRLKFFRNLRIHILGNGLIHDKGNRIAVYLKGKQKTDTAFPAKFFKLFIALLTLLHPIISCYLCS